MSGGLAPSDEAGVAAAVADAVRAREPLAVFGNRSKAGMLRPVQAARALSTANLTGITLYAPKELVISARAGTTLTEIEATVTAQGQHMIAEPPDYGALLGTEGAQTIGGLVAANLSGPRRIAWGATRDHVLGIRAVNGAGEVIRSGGRVLKNVTGLDLCKLLAGSHGTLGVMTEITMKVLPAPERVGTLAIPGLDATAGAAALAAALGSPFGVSGAAWLPEAAASRIGFDTSVTLARIEEFAASVAYRTAKLREAIGRGGEILDDPTSRALWRAIRDATPLPAAPEDAVWRVSVRPSAGPAVLRAAEEAFGGRGFLDWGGGLVWLCGPATEDAHAAICRIVGRIGGTWLLFRAPEPLRAAVAVIPPEAPPLAALSARVKAALDPQGILNPGRMYAGV